MKILLVQEISGVHEYLQRGLVELGHDCHLATFGFPTKRIVANEIKLSPFKSLGSLGKPFRPIYNLLSAMRLQHYDVISFIHQISFIYNPVFLRYIDTPWVAEKAKVMSYTALGCDELALIYENPILPYRPCHSCEREDIAGQHCLNVNRDLHVGAKGLLNKHFDVVTSPAIEYDHVRQYFNGQSEKIPFPIDLSDIEWKPAVGTNNMIRIVHTPTRTGFKGTTVVLEAINKLKQKRSDFHFEVLSGLSFSDYTAKVELADIVIDQVWSQSSGMNALWLLAMGKVVFSGNTSLCKDYFPFGYDNPTIDASPNADDLASSIETLLDDRNSIKFITEMGREYVSKNHDHIKIASQYAKLWSDVAQARNS
jgi:glycosyltransferase involved in cell wall biosynthesis